MRWLLVIVVIILLPPRDCWSAPPAAESPWIAITPEWVLQHPGRLQAFGGTAASGLNNYGFQLQTDGNYRWKIVTRLLPKKSDGFTSLYETMSRTGGVTDTVEVGYVENQPYAFDVVFHIERIPADSDKGLPQLIYVIKLADYDRLVAALQEAQRSKK